MTDAFASPSTLKVGQRSYRIHRLDALEKQGMNVSRLPYALRILLENVLRLQDGVNVTRAHVEALARWQAKAKPSREIPFTPARVLLQDFTGVPAVVDLAAMREAMKRMGSDPSRINPQLPVELVIDHSVQVDEYGSAGAFLHNVEREYERNRERYAFLRWGQKAFDNFKVVPPGTGICHQVNLEYLARVVMTAETKDGQTIAYPDTLVGTDSHTTMINGLGVLGWGVGGIEAEAAMLGEAITMLIPQVVGFRLYGRLAEGSTATDLVLRVTQMLREKGVVGKFVEYFGEGLAHLPLADRATIANMSPEYGATCGIFPVDAETLTYLKFTGRSPERVALVEAYMKEQGLFHTADRPVAEYSDTLELDMGTVEPSLAGPRRPQDRVSLREMGRAFRASLGSLVQAPRKPPATHAATKDQDNEGNGAARSTPSGASDSAGVQVRDAGTENVSVTTSLNGEKITLGHGSVVIAAITSCTNTSNPSVMIAAGLVAKKAVERGLMTRPWVKTSLAPGSQVVTDYLNEAGLTPYLDQLRFNLVGYGCTTCIGNSGPLPPPVSQAIATGNLVAASVLSGNRNFEGRVHAEVRANYLASPPLVVAYALAGRVDIDLHTEPLGTGKDGKSVYLRDVWPTQQEVAETVRRAVRAQMFQHCYSNVFAGDETWQSLEIPEGNTYAWDPQSTYVKHPPFFEDMPATPPAATDITAARALAVLGDSITTDHISPAGAFRPDSPAGKYLQSLGVEPRDFNSYGSRRGNHEVMMRGTFGNVRLRNLLVPGVEGGETVHLPDGRQVPIYDAAMKYRQQGTPAIVLGGKQYGSGSSRDWAAKGPCLLGVRAVIAQSFERIHRSNLVGLGILPLEFKPGESAESLGLTGREQFDVIGLPDGLKNNFADGREVTVRAHAEDGKAIEFGAVVRLDTPKEMDYYRHGGILQYVLRKLQSGKA